MCFILTAANMRGFGVVFTKGNLSRVMRHINGVYTQYFNRMNDSDGPLFKGRFKAVLIEQGAALLKLSH